jgi:hypothetical protein
MWYIFRPYDEPSTAASATSATEALASYTNNAASAAKAASMSRGKMMGKEPAPKAPVREKSPEDVGAEGRSNFGHFWRNQQCAVLAHSGYKLC